MVSTLFKRAQLRRIYRQVPGTYATLLAALNASNDSAAALASSGSGGAVTQVSANGHSIEFSDANDSNTVTPSDLAEASGQLLDLYDSALAALVASGIPVPSDAQVYVQMLAELQPAYFATPDFSNLHYARA